MIKKILIMITTVHHTRHCYICMFVYVSKLRKQKINTLKYADQICYIHPYQNNYLGHYTKAS